MRWMSILEAMRYADEENTTKLLLPLYQGIQKQWVTSYEDIWRAKGVPAMEAEMSTLLPALPQVKKRRPRRRR